MKLPVSRFVSANYSCEAHPRCGDQVGGKSAACGYLVSGTAARAPSSCYNITQTPFG